MAAEYRTNNQTKAQISAHVLTMRRAFAEQNFDRAAKQAEWAERGLTHLIVDCDEVLSMSANAEIRKHCRTLYRWAVATRDEVREILASVG